MSLQELSRPDQRKSENKIIFSHDLPSTLLDTNTLLPDSQDRTVGQGQDFLVQVDTDDPAIMQALEQREFGQRSRTAIVGLHITDVNTDVDDEGNKRVLLRIQNMSPMDIIVPPVYSFVRAILERPEKPLRGQALFDQAQTMLNHRNPENVHDGDSIEMREANIGLRTKKGDIFYLSELNQMDEVSLAPYLDEDGENAFAQVVCRLGEIGLIQRTDPIALKDLAGRADGLLEEQLAIRWFDGNAQDGSALDALATQDYPLVLRRTVSIVPVSKHHAAELVSEGLDAGEASHGEADILEGVSGDTGGDERQQIRSDWQIITEYPLTTDVFSMPEVAVFELYEAA